MSTKFTDEHVWIRPDTANQLLATVGITVHAQETLGDIVFVDLPEIGKTFEAKAVAGVVESVKAAADVFMPAAGAITEVNEALRADPALANSDPLGAGWFFRVMLSKPEELDALMDEARYMQFSAS
jgi:glycine cleavage system H protein